MRRQILKSKEELWLKRWMSYSWKPKYTTNKYQKPQAYDFGSSPQFLYFYYPAVGIIGTNFPNFPYL